MKSDHAPSFVPKRMLFIILFMVTAVICGILLIKNNTSASAAFNQLISRDELTEEKLDKRLGELLKTSNEKFDSLLVEVKACNEKIAGKAGETLVKLEELKASTSQSLEKIGLTWKRQNELDSGQLDLSDDNGAMPMLQKFYKAFGGNLTFKANPGNPASITEWWEAAAMMGWYMNPTLRHSCKNLVNFGNWPVCQDEPYVIKPPCLVYSFGIANDFSFDDAMGNLGCTVASFDPSMHKEDHIRSPHVSFYNMGMGAINTNSFVPNKDSYVKNDQKWKIRTLKGAMAELGHQNRVLDVLKMDVETYEWAVLDNMFETGMLTNIRHLLIEYHLFRTRPDKGDYVYNYKLLNRLRKLGFREYHYETCCLRMTNANEFNYQSHVSYVNAYFRPPS
ncbi:unnamed protein product [Lymnaea stagnalis]|uniref:Methyltransferase domain-containing protein n=1 Tax=Lymnaea stagnalis TaxID=6523 RepID=A0AAV2HU02_LYMST